ncbi:NAD-dependent succinate-semialdehyde dehydrogenase [Pseudohongiella sp. O18]|uniref:NAD-dependent succinate-semialdehyde dehydrogenase n=1 Tax=Pseudohongiella sp. O18 TaxID=2904248 RepID=UPI001F33C771|nr:NAD-dependent succinate-semialdehyde dehydrogenase [Pseudohongiella sp. O18]
MKQISSINPFSGETLDTYEAFDLTALDSTLAAADQAQKMWQTTELSTRASVLRSLAKQLKAQRDTLARTATLEMGKTLASARAEVDKCAWACEYYADNGPAMLQSETVPSDDDAERIICYQPLGLVLAIMPWNFPYWQVFRFLAPALMAGNGAILKHASNVPGCAMAIEAICRDANVPENLFRSLLVSSKDADRLIEHPLIKAVTFTGSTNAGRKIASTAGKCLKKTVLELGGSDPYLVLDDADIDLAVEKCVTSRLLNNGQSCIAAKRFIVHDSLYGEFASAMAAAMNKKRVGDPLLEDTDIGPQAKQDLCDELTRQVNETIRLGAVLVSGGQSEGATYWPTVLGEVRPGMPAFDEELFGPVAALIRARDENEAISLANQSAFGLGSAVFTRDAARGRRVALALEAGACAVNDFVKSEPAMPFGGIKASGYGRELGPFGIREFTNIKAMLLR